MSQKFRLAVADRVAVQVKGKLQGAERHQSTKVDFTLDMDRLDQTQIEAAIANSDTIADFLASHAHGWNGQALVVDAETNRPATFSEEAFRALLEAPGMTVWVYRAYLRDLGVQERN